MQVPHTLVGAVPVDLGAALASGCYVAQVRLPPDTIGVLYATAATPPADALDWFEARGTTCFAFTVGADVPPTWAVAALPDRPGVPLALAKV